MKPTCILVVDDNPTNLKLVADVLECEGHAVLRANDAQEALAVLRHAQPEVILMDLQMPGMDGLTLTRRLKADPTTRHIRIVALTAFAMKGDEEKAREAGCDGYITKPIDTRALSSQIGACMERTPPSNPGETGGHAHTPRPDRERHRATGRVARKGAKAMNLLIVDDMPLNLKLLHAQLEGEGHTILEAADGVDALARLEREHVDAVITDILMPRMDGYRLCHEIRTSDRLRDLPVIIYTSTYTSPADAKLALDVGADKYLTKPASLETLLGALQEVTATSRTAPRAAAMPEVEVLKEYSAQLVAKLGEKNTELIVADEKLRQLLAHSPAVIYTLKLDGRTIQPALVSDNLELVLGIPAAETAHDGWWLEHLHPDDRDRVMKTLTTAQMNGGFSLEYRLRHKDGTYHWVADNNRLAGHSAGQTKEAVGVWTDITERKRAQQEILRLNADLEKRVIERTAELEAANKELEAFSYSVSHDLRNPLQGIVGFSEILAAQSGRLDEKGRECLHLVRSNADRMGRLIADLLLLSHISRSSLTRERVNLSDLARVVAAELLLREPERKVALDFQQGLVAEADSGLLRAVLENLLGNAWKFTGKTTDPRIEFGVTEHPGGTAFFVRDNGAGFDMAYVGKLFNPFQRLHPEAEFSGTGIGLATVRRIIERHGGRVWAEGEVGKGATVFFTLPPIETGGRK